MRHATGVPVYQAPVCHNDLPTLTPQHDELRSFFLHVGGGLRAKRFFAERVPQAAAYVEKEGPQFVVLRGQGGEEVVIRAWADGGATTRVRASTLFFDQALDRFFSTLPLESGVEVA